MGVFSWIDHGKIVLVHFDRINHDIGELGPDPPDEVEAIQEAGNNSDHHSKRRGRNRLDCIAVASLSK